MSGTRDQSQPMPADRALRQQFLHGMSHAACTVNVVTTDGVAGRHGVTVSAMVSVSADTPQPTLLVCIHHLSPVIDALLKNGLWNGAAVPRICARRRAKLITCRSDTTWTYGLAAPQSG